VPAERPWVAPAWAAPPGVRALTTTRQGGVSPPPFDTLNLGAHAGDAPEAVAANRRRLRHRAALPEPPRWLRQVHGAEVVAAHRAGTDAVADAAWTDRPGVVCAVLTADCLPVVLAARDGRAVAVAHAGWRGLAAGVLEAAVAALPVPAQAVLAWLGPAIGPAAFEVGPEVAAALTDGDPPAQACLAPGRGERCHADLYALAGRRLRAAGVAAVYGGGWCTYTERARFFSHRRDGPTGRMATLAYRAASCPSGS